MYNVQTKKHFTIENEKTGSATECKHDSVYTEMTIIDQHKSIDQQNQVMIRFNKHK
jgi:hypothetical protein